jgi:hypothetical protein
MATSVQFLIACAAGAWAYLGIRSDGTYATAATLGALLIGFAVQWGAVFCYAWARYGWAAARSVSLF